MIVAAVLTALAAACGGSGSSKASGSGTTTTTAAGSSSASGSGTTTTQKISGDSNSNFCRYARDVEKSFTPDVGADPSSIRSLMEQAGKAMQQAVKIAPAEIKPDFQTFVDAFTPYLQALKDANYDYTKIDPTKLQSITAPDVTAASQHISAYMTQVCHITDTTPST